MKPTRIININLFLVMVLSGCAGAAQIPVSNLVTSTGESLFPGIVSSEDSNQIGDGTNPTILEVNTTSSTQDNRLKRH